MDCTPEKCPHRGLMEAARAACLSCGHVEPSGRGGVASFDAMGERLVERERLPLPREARGQVTALPAEVEERTAEVFRRWCALDTIDALLMLHVCNGGTTANFGGYLDRVARAIARAGTGRRSYRATAWAKYKALVRRFEPVLKSRLHSWTDGHGGAVRREREGAEREAAQGDLFALSEASDGK